MTRGRSLHWASDWSSSDAQLFPLFDDDRFHAFDRIRYPVSDLLGAPAQLRQLPLLLPGSYHDCAEHVEEFISDKNKANYCD
ncbi:MAG TPA: hypothetical protein P5046_00335, partial [Sphaerochaeta sp.]|nr:hypothetical protein [Sphaerochaeta sp.]